MEIYRMKKSLLAVAAVTAFAGAAQAQSSVTIYGVMDVDAGYVQRSNGGDSTFGTTIAVPVGAVSTNNLGTGTAGQPGNNVHGAGFIGTGGESATQIGFKGTEDMGGGLKTNFQFETGFNATSGSISSGMGAQFNKDGGSGATSLNGQLFNRQAWVGLSDAKVGALSVGRQYTGFMTVVNGYDLVKAQAFSPIQYSGNLGGGGGITDSIRQDSSIKYVSPAFANTTLTAMYKAGNQMGSIGPQSSYNFAANYDGGKYHFGIAYMASNDALLTSSSNNAAATPAAVTSSGNIVYGSATTATAPVGTVTAYNTSAVAIGGDWSVTDKIKFGAGWQLFTYKAPAQNVTTGATGNLISQYGYSISTATNYGGSNQANNLEWITANVKTSAATDVSVGFYNLNQGGYTLNNATVGAGAMQWYSLLGNYYFSKRTNLYAGYMLEKLRGTQQGAAGPAAGVTGSYNPGQYYNTNSIAAIGMRHTF
jgi:general bacterial porin, GBP family